MVSEFLASPGGKLTGLTALRNRQGWLMRGGDRLVSECSWMNGICSNFLHSTGESKTFKLSPPLISLFCQSVPKCRLSKNPASPRGKPRTQKTLATTIQRTALLRGLRVARLATPTRAALKSIGFEPSRHRAGQGTNVLVQASQRH